ncbi:methyltransferase domain-containing protein [Aliarcobacter butzleri]|uniref:methyltransferase domain-containing protein n=1 Tax=Aliarcobacter butzleri TaxID=28197 RepID=UPI003AFAE348
MSDNIIDEFYDISRKMNNPKGIRKIVYKLSGWFSLNFTVFLQKFGINKNLKNKFKDDKFILNIGSGDEFPEKCINTDLFPSFGKLLRIILGKEKKQIQCYLNVVYKDKNLFEIADGIVFSHVLEHIPPFLTMVVLENLRDYLKKGSFLRISVPDIRLYENNKLPPDQGYSNQIIAKNSLIYRWGHQFMYDENLLKALLEEIGFNDVEVVSFKIGQLGEFDIERRQNETLYIVAKKK